MYAHREDADNHRAFRKWLEGVVGSNQAFGVSEMVLSGFLRVVTHPRIFKSPTPLPVAFRFVDDLRAQSNCVRISPGERHWEIFRDLCNRAGTKGSLVADAYLAALAVESGSEWITTDRDYSRFPGLKWRHPL